MVTETKKTEYEIALDRIKNSPLGFFTEENKKQDKEDSDETKTIII